MIFNSKSSIILISILFALSTIEADSEECNRITIEGGEQALRKIFNDFKDLKQQINEIKTNLEIDQPTNNNFRPKDISCFDERIDKMAEKCYKTLRPKDCASATECTKRSGIYKIQVKQYSNDPFYVTCDAETDNGDWLVIQKRQDGSVDFYRNWVEYEESFGDLEGEFFIGLKKLYALTNFNGPQELLIVMEDVNAVRVYAKYDAFAIGNATEFYKLKRLGKYSGTAGNSLQFHVGMKFSTKDRDNDEFAKGSCAVDQLGAWWYRWCHINHLNGKYGDKSTQGVIWKSFRGYNESVAYVKMMIRRSRTI